jgi:N,N'-diacetyllegionaminate synthase
VTVLIIAEIGVNHNGDIDLAHEMVDAAANAGADVVKFQTFQAGLLSTVGAKLADYQSKGRANVSSQYEMLKELELDRADHESLISHCRSLGVEFLSSAFDLESLKMLNDLNLDQFKIPSGEITNLQYLRLVGSYGKRVIISSGMADIEEIKRAVNVLLDSGLQRDLITVMHCNSAYPTPFGDVNLRALWDIRDRIGVATGYSDHTTGIEVPIAAVALGAVAIEKHFTTDQNLPGPDHKASLQVEEFKDMVRAIRNIEVALGDGEKRVMSSENENRNLTRKSLVAARSIRAGELFTDENITAKRPGIGLSPMYWDEILGQAAKKDYLADDLIEL